MMETPEIQFPSNEFRYFTKEALIEACRTAIKTDRNRQLDADVLDTLLGEEFKYPVVMAFVHNEEEMRLQIVLGPHETDIGWLDVPFDTYDNLPVETITAH
jgi:hypothetical protein